MDWYETLKNDLERITAEAAYELWPPIGSCTLPFFNHRLNHVGQVEKEARRLMSTYGGDEDTVLASVWIHDRTKRQFEGPDHANRAADWALAHLESIGFPKEKVGAVEYAVRNHAGWTRQNLQTLEAQILWDADKLSHFGPSYLFEMIFIFSSKRICDEDRTGLIRFKETVSLENLLPRLSRMKGEFDPEHADRTFYLAESKTILAEKQAAVNAFLDALTAGL